MKLAKKLLAFALAGAMLLAVLTGCSSGKSSNELVEQYAETYFHSFYGENVTITHDVPELKTVAANFDPAWLKEDGIGFSPSIVYPDDSYTPVPLPQITTPLEKYKKTNTRIWLYALEVKDNMSELTQFNLMWHHSGPYPIQSNSSLASTQSINYATTLVKKGGKTYRIAVFIQTLVNS